MGNIEIVRISTKGQLIIPAKLRKKLKLVEGSKLSIVEQGNGVFMRPIPRLSSMRGITKGAHLSRELRRLRKHDLELESEARE